MSVKLSQIPVEVLATIDTIKEGGFEAWVVGGCVRDLLVSKKPKDWDITSNATPEDIQRLFKDTFYTNEYGTVGVINETTTDGSLRVIEITPYRLEGRYSDARRPDSVIFSHKIEDDLKRRDFTINALAYDPKDEELLDLYNGISDINKGLLRAVGDANERFTEDALRILRAIRISAEMGFTIEPSTKEAMRVCARQLGKISKERVRDELVRILLSPRPMQALQLAHELGVLVFMAPEIEEGIGIGQNQAHSYDVYEHNLRAMQHAADKTWSLDIRLAALYHDVGKPSVRQWSEAKNDWTFHGHDVVGAKMTKKALETLKFSRETVILIEKLVRWHMFFSDPDKVTLSAVRRIIRNVGTENIQSLIELRICDRIGTGRPKEQPFRLRKYQAMIEQALRDPISVNMLAIDGSRIMDVTHEKPGPRIGWVLHALLEDVLDEPTKNTRAYLEEQALKLSAMSDKNLKELGREGLIKKRELEQEHIKDIHKKYFVD